MRIGLVVLGGLHPSGHEQVMPSWLTLIGRLARRHEVHAFVLHHLSQPQSYDLLGARVHDLGAPARSALVGRWAQRRALGAALARHGPFDVLHGFWGDPPGLLAADAARRLRTPSVVTFNSGELVSLPDIGYGGQRTRQGRVAVHLAARWATRVHVASEHMEQAARRHGLDVVRFPLGIDRQLAESIGQDVEPPPWRLLQIASINRVKDPATLLDAVALATRELDVHLDIVGEDTLEGAVLRHAERAGLTRRVTFHGFVAHDRLPAFRARAHLYVQSSRHEGSGSSVLEAAASGLPIVGTRVGYVADWSPSAATAVEPGDAPGLAAAIVALLRDPARRRTQAVAAQRFALAHDVDWSVTRLEELYGSVRREFREVDGEAG
ncbi:MAG: glycosyltransferase family 4 protein [Vicinamibacterales bacterium]